MMPDVRVEVEGMGVERWPQMTQTCASPKRFATALILQIIFFADVVFIARPRLQCSIGEIGEICG
jgi:hypothetical protein